GEDRDAFREVPSCVWIHAPLDQLNGDREPGRTDEDDERLVLERIEEHRNDGLRPHLGQPVLPKTGAAGPDLGRGKAAVYVATEGRSLAKCLGKSVHAPPLWHVFRGGSIFVRCAKRRLISYNFLHGSKL